MSFIGLIAAVANFLLLIYFIVLLVRLVFEYIPIFNREWRPKGVGLVVAEIVYTITDPPIKLFRRILPPLRIGGMALDFGFTLTMLVVLILMSVTRALSYA